MSKLGPKYKAPWQTTPRENEILSWYHQGQSDPLYAIMSRCVGRMRNKQPVKGMNDVDSLRDAANIVHNTLGWLKHYQR